MKKTLIESFEEPQLKGKKRKSSFDWLLFSFLTIVIILLVLLLSYK